MSGTSMGGVEAALITTDGVDYLQLGPHRSVPYPPDLREALLAFSSESDKTQLLDAEVTDAHINAVQEFCSDAQVDLASIDVVGFHGQTVLHDPGSGVTRQLGDGQRMADSLQRSVVNEFRQNDMKHGGQGAPLAPAYHRLLVRCSGIGDSVAVLNIGGVSNVTLVNGGEIHACDCGPGNALIDDWVRKRCGLPFDDRGRIAAAGHVNRQVLRTLLDHPYFLCKGPKSLDRNSFSTDAVSALSIEDGAATLTAFTAEAITTEANRLSNRPSQWIIVGGGRKNDTLVQILRNRLGVPVLKADELGWNGDAIEAQAFAYLAVRSILRLPLSWPTTTGVAKPVSGGTQWEPAP